MNISTQLLFFFSALGVFNGLLLVAYLWRAGSAATSHHQTLAYRFLSLMLMMICVRVGKSVLFFFYPDLAKIYLQMGLSACFLIGPFLYFYISAAFGRLNEKKTRLQLMVLLGLIVGVGLVYPYETYPDIWRHIIFRTVNLTWFVYLVLAWQLLYISTRAEGLTTWKDGLSKYAIEISVLGGNSVIWMAYYTSLYTSYIAGALSFSFITYLTVLIYLQRRNAAPQPAPNKYTDKSLDDEKARHLTQGLLGLMEQEKLFTDANLTLPTVAKKLNTNVPVLSQLLNDNLHKSFSQFINEYRIEEAKRSLLAKPSLSIEMIAEECGFNSQSTFYVAFKKQTATTPAKFRQTASQRQKERYSAASFDS